MTWTLRLAPTTIMVMLILTNFLNYLDRGIIPGAAGAFDKFINHQSTELAGTTHTNTCVRSFFLLPRVLSQHPRRRRRRHRVVY